MTDKYLFSTAELEKEIKEQYLNQECYTFRDVLKWKLAERNHLKAEVEKIINDFTDNIEIIREDNQRRLMISKVELLIKLKELKSKLFGTGK